MASSSSSLTLQTLQGSLLRSHFLGQNNILSIPRRPSTLISKESRFRLRCAKFDLFQILGGRGLCNGEMGVQEELKKGINIEEQANADAAKDPVTGNTETGNAEGGVPEDGFEKELMGLTGGFPGGEKGLKKFIDENPPPKKQPLADSENLLAFTASMKLKPPQLPMLMPGMIAIVKNQNSPYYMYCGIVQRITDGKAGVLFEGGIWDRLITFRLEELERREKGHPGKNPRSAVIEALYKQDA